MSVLPVTLTNVVTDGLLTCAGPSYRPSYSSCPVRCSHNNERLLVKAAFHLSCLRRGLRQVLSRKICQKSVYNLSATCRKPVTNFKSRGAIVVTLFVEVIHYAIPCDTEICFFIGRPMRKVLQVLLSFLIQLVRDQVLSRF